MSKESRVGVQIIPADVETILDYEPFIATLPKIDEITPVVGGVAHRVFQIMSDSSKYYLKIRGDRFASVPEIMCNPEDIIFEYRALSAFHQIAPDNFPQIFAFNKDRHYLILSDAMPNGEKMEDLFLKREVTPKMLFNLGRTLAQIHEASSSCHEAVRPDGDDEYYQTVLGHRFGYRRNPVLDNLVQSLSTLGYKQLILGDVSPKNIGVNNDGELFIFFDLETAHQGDRVFDYAYFLGHILIHSLVSQDAILAVESYVQGYDQQNFDESVVKKIALGTMLYRLRSIISYPTGLDAEQTALLEQKIESILLQDLSRSDWLKIITIIQHGQK